MKLITRHGNHAGVKCMLYRSQSAARFLVFITLLVTVIAMPHLACAQDLSDYTFLKSITSNAYPHAHTVLSRETETVEFNSDGTSRETDEVFLTILNQDGVRKNSTTTFYINRHYSRLTIELFEIIGADGAATPVDLKRYAREDSSAAASRMNIYDPAQRELRVFIPELHAGDTIHYRVTRDNFKTMIPGQFFGRKQAEYTFPVREYRVEITGPESMDIHTLIKDGQNGRYSSNKFTASGRTTHVFVFRDVPALVPEPAMPPLPRVTMRLLYSTIGSWNFVAQWYSRLVEPHLASTPAITAKVQELTAEKHSQDEKLAAIFYFVAQKIRYMGITAERDRPGYEPHDVSLTFSRRYGVCRDKAALLVTMLREAGFRAAPVIISAGSILDSEVVVPWFNHAIAAVLDKSNKPILYMDPTSETSRQFLPDYERHSSCLVASSHGSDLLLTPEPDANANLSNFRIEDRLHVNGVLSGTIHATLTGFCDTALRGAMMSSSEEKRKQILEELLQNRIPGIIIHDLQWSDPENRGIPFSFHCSFDAVNRTRVTADGRVLFYPVANMDYIGVLDKYLMERASLSSRRYPLRFNYVVKSTMKEQTVLGPGWDICHMMLPHPERAACRQAEAACRAELCNRTLVINRDFKITALEVPAKDYSNILMIQKHLRDIAITPIILGYNHREKDMATAHTDKTGRDFGGKHR